MVHQTFYTAPTSHTAKNYQCNMTREKNADSIKPCAVVHNVYSPKLFPTQLHCLCFVVKKTNAFNWQQFPNFRQICLKRVVSMSVVFEVIRKIGH